MIYRHVEPVFVQLTYCNKVLVERAQILPSGKRRERNSTLAEKREPGDSDPIAAALRGVREELHVDLSLEDEGILTHSTGYAMEKMDSKSYPGLEAVYETHYVHLELLQGGEASNRFARSGLLGPGVFTTEESRPDGKLQSIWEWMDIEDARRTSVKGLPGASCDGSRSLPSLLQANQEVAHGNSSPDAKLCKRGSPRNLSSSTPCRKSTGFYWEGTKQDALLVAPLRRCGGLVLCWSGLCRLLLLS
eukprot:TRINITY_DN15009_c0_g1_i1.p1 TRINITY_DN15009_c0_g1~~TRINITY_DN15009_c0_g1_i1.p1  ORF type:complete len:247 (-),score=41.57 TRINITY_DN15009_c0_g1_i1:16-756(-)